MPASPFDFEHGITQCRITPLKGAPFAGKFAFTLGYDGPVPRYEDIGLNDYIQVQQTLDVTNLALIRAHVRITQPQTMPNLTDISKNFQLIGETSLSPGNKIVKEAGVSQTDIGQFITVTGATNGANNTTLRMVGIRDSVTAYVDKTVVTEGPRSTIVATQLGLRWKVSLLIDVSGTPTEFARVVQSYNEAGFYRDDLSVNVSKMTGSHVIYFRLTLIQQTINNIYSMS
jgi:hypothetical protein